MATRQAVDEPQSLGTFGDVDVEEMVEQLEKPPIPFSIVGFYRKKDDNGEHLTEQFDFHVQGELPFGAMLNVLQYADENGQIPVDIAVKFLGDALVADDFERFNKTLRRRDIDFHAQAIGDLAMALAERYGMRPTQPRSARRAGPRRTGQTSTAGRSGRASTSGRSTPRTRST